MEPSILEKEGIYLIINNIPKDFHASDLRNFFTSHIESGSFVCFHFRHRPEVQKPVDSNKDNDRTRKVTNCCVIKIIQKQVEDFIKSYGGQHWLDPKGQTLMTKCFIRKVSLSSETFPEYGISSTSVKKGTIATNFPLDKECFSLEDLESLIEMHPPSFMPNGNVGTKTSHFLNEIRACRLPPSLITKLGLQFPRNRARRIYGCVPPMGFKKMLQDGKETILHSTDSGKKKPWCSHLPEETAKEKKEDSSEESEEEEWDRVETFHDDITNQGRNKERLFEEKIELKWEKGGSGLVFYTDAQFWDLKDGDFDEKTADDWDIDARVYDGAEQDADKDMKDFVRMRLETRLRDGTDTETDRRYNFAAFEKYSKGFGRKVLESQGWKQGQGVGRNAAGISEPIPNDGQLPSDKKGFGYRGEKLNREVPSGSKHKRRRRSFEDEGVFISTIYDNPRESDPPHSVLTSSSFAKLKYRKEFLKEHNCDV